MAQPSRLPRREELVNTLEFEEVARLVLSPAVFATIAGSERAAFDRMTFRPRVLVPSLDMDLSVQLLGETLFTPIIVGPVADQRRYHAEGELATARGAAAAHAVMIVSSRSSVPIDEIAAQAKTPLWYGVYPDAKARQQIARAVGAGCKAVFVAAGESEQSGPRTRATSFDWQTIDDIRRGVDVPVVVKGVMTPQQAKAAIDAGMHGVVVSDYGTALSDKQAPIETLASIVEVCAGKAAVLVDGSFRRGSDVTKALVLGAQATLVARPVMWGLAAYGAEGVQTVIELLQNDLGRNMGALGAPNLKSLNRDMVRIHRR
jgi:isopentenyl diphosphate isomerase/L-lactate dehydrogenase-like FMN-dependent dehydrogenase